MKITGYRLLRTFHDWGRPVGDVNGFIDPGVTEVPIVILETDEGIEGIGTGSHQDIERLFPAIEGEDPRAVTALRCDFRWHRHHGHGDLGPESEDCG